MKDDTYIGLLLITIGSTQAVMMWFDDKARVMSISCATIIFGLYLILIKNRTITLTEASE